jgi:hypothetical protein
VLDEGASGDGTLIAFDGGDWNAPPMWGVDYAATDDAVALALLSGPPSEVSRVLADDWARWTDPTTSSAALADAASVDGRSRRRQRRLWSPCP